jgi:PTH1 family peptidyl-tRNA hydrolase
MSDSAVPGIRSDAAGIRLLAGLGNPGREYEGTRHNIGFAVLDKLAAQLGATFTKEPKWDAQVARVPGSDLTLIKPSTFMNLSGEAVGGYARFYRIPAASVLVVVDDVALPLGALRIRRDGGAGGQKGLSSVLVHFATEQVPRLRVGVGGAAEGKDLSSHVLSRFRPEEQTSVEETLSRAAEAALSAVRNGVEQAMNLYNATPSSVKPDDNNANQP